MRELLEQIQISRFPDIDEHNHKIPPVYLQYTRIKASKLIFIIICFELN